MAEYQELKIAAAGSRCGMVVWKPITPEVGKKYPLVIFHHGAGEKGNGSLTDLEKLRSNGSVSALEAGCKKYDFFLVEPQTPADWQYGETQEAYDYMTTTYGDNIDFNRIYITGLSLGGGGSIRFLAYNPDFANAHIAAVSPMCPGPLEFFVTNGETGYQNVAKYKGVIWLFHCADDATVTPAQSTNLVYNKVKGYNPSAKIIKTIWNSGGHTGGWKTWNRYSDTSVATSPAEATQFNDPADNWFEWIQTQTLTSQSLPRRIGTPDPTTSTTTSTTTTTTTTKRPAVTKTLTLRSFTLSADPLVKNGVAVDVTWSDGTITKTESYRAATGDRIAGVSGNLERKTLVLDYVLVPNVVLGPTKTFDIV